MTSLMMPTAPYVLLRKNVVLIKQAQVLGLTLLRHA